MTPRQWGFASAAIGAMLVPTLLHGGVPLDWVNLAGRTDIEAVPPGPGDVLGTLALDGGALGATGQLPETDELSASLLADADDPGEFEDDLPPLEGGFLREGQHGIPGVMLDAYLRAADRLAETTPGCNLDWPLLASIGRIESGHARGGRVAENGDTVERILGPVLNGSPGVAAIRDTDGGRFDADTTWDRAVGPMQFIPSTWAGYAADGNEDGERNPNNVYDATIGAGNYLCAHDADLGDPQQRARSVFRYNQSNSYVATVLYWADLYANGVTPTPDVIGSDDDFGDDGSDSPGGTPPGSSNPPSTSTPPSTTNPPSTNPTTITLVPSNPTTTTTTTTTTTPQCPTGTPTPTGTTTTSPTTTTTTVPVPPNCPTTTTTTPTTTTTTTATTTAAESSAATTGPASTPGASSSAGSSSSTGSSVGSSVGSSSATSSMRPA